MEAPVAVPVEDGPFWGEYGHLIQGIGNDPRKLRGMLRRLDLPRCEAGLLVFRSTGRDLNSPHFLRKYFPKSRSFGL